MTEDTREKRRQAARRYLTAMPIIQQMIAPAAAAVGSPERGRALAREVREDVLEAELMEALVHVFTYTELDALAQFYSSPEWRSAAPKMERFAAEAGRRIRPEIERARRAALGE